MRIDAIYHNADIVTLDDGRPRAEALAVWRGLLVGVGEARQLEEDFTPRRRLDLGGRTVVPGFNDAHNHMVFHGMSLTEVPLHSPPIESVDQIYEAIREEARRVPEGGWVVGAGYDQNKLRERRHPSREQLDRVAPRHLVWLRHNSGHMCVVNTAVLERIGVGSVEVPEGGVVERDEHGSPTGLLLEQAQLLVRDLVHPYPVATVVDAIARAGAQYVREGITSCQEAGIGGGILGSSALEILAYQEARRSGRLPVRVSLMIAAEALHELDRHEADPGGFALDLGIHTGFGDEWLRIGPMKIFADGSLIGRTAAMLEDFANEPGNRGFFQTEPAKLRNTIVEAHRSGWQVATHAIGDRAVCTVLDIYEEALRDRPRPDHRHRIEHCGVLPDDQVGRMRDLGVIPVPQGRFVNEIGDGMVEALGPRRVRSAYRQRSFLDAGIPLPGSSDRPVVQGPPLLGIHDMVNQKTAKGADFNPAEALTPLQALRCYTLGSAYASFDEHRKGSLEPGKLADFTVLSQDPTAVDPVAISSIEVLATVVGGEVAHDGMGLT